MRSQRLSREGRISLYVVLVLSTQLLVYRAKVWYPDRDISYDSPYHITMADLFGQIAWRRTFPATYQSIWATHFADKELGFHLLLCSLRRWAGLFGYRGAAPPFILETACLLLGLMVAFLAAMHVLRVRQGFVFLPLLLFAVPLFTLRMNLVRPHCVSVILMLLTATWLAETTDQKRTLWRLGAVGFLFSYFHSNPHFVLLPAGCYALAAFPEHGWRAALPALAAAAGVAAGLTLHPQFPNTFLIWKIQCIDVLWQALTHRVPEVVPPMELARPELTTILQNLGLPILAAGTLGLAAWRRRQGHAIPRATRLFLLLSVVSVAGFFVSKRVIEYAVPFTVVAAALVYQELNGERSLRFHLFCLAGTMALGLALTPLHLAYLGASGVPIPRQFAAWARERLPPGARIALFRWDDFPHVFFAAPEYSYSYGLDPQFAYVANPANYRRIERLYGLWEPMPAAPELLRLFQARLLYVSVRHHPLARYLAQSGIALAYQGVDGWCFDLAAPPVDHHIPGPLPRLRQASGPHPPP